MKEKSLCLYPRSFGAADFFSGVKQIVFDLHAFYITELTKKRAKYFFLPRTSSRYSEPVTAVRQFEFIKDVEDIFVHRHQIPFL